MKKLFLSALILGFSTSLSREWISRAANSFIPNWTGTGGKVSAGSYNA